MASFFSSSTSLFFSFFTSSHQHHHNHNHYHYHYHYHFRLLSSITIPFRSPPPLQASRKYPNCPEEPVAVVRNPLAWARDLGEDEREDDKEEEEDEDDRSLDLLASFLHSLFRKISRRARKAARSLLPPSIPTKLVGFSVNGVLVLGFLWILKALLEVACTVGSMVFVSILLVRGIWSGISYIREQRYYNSLSRMDSHNRTWDSVQPVS